MNEANLSTSPTSAMSVPPEGMLKRVLGVARILALSKHAQDLEKELAKDCAQKLQQRELQYRKDELNHKLHG